MNTHRVKSTSLSVQAKASQRAVMDPREIDRSVTVLFVLFIITVIKSVAMDTFILLLWRKVKETEDMPHMEEKR